MSVTPPFLPPIILQMYRTLANVVGDFLQKIDLETRQLKNTSKYMCSGKNLLKVVAVNKRLQVELTRGLSQFESSLLHTGVA